MNRISDFMNEEEYDPIADMISGIVDEIVDCDGDPDLIYEVLDRFYRQTVDISYRNATKNAAIVLMSMVD